MSSMRIALAQICPVVAPVALAIEGDDIFEVLERNLLETKRWVEKAAAEHADVVVFPEYFLQGLVDNGRQHLTEYLSHLAQGFNVSIVGTIVHCVCEDLPSTSPFTHLMLSSSSKPDMEQWRQYVKANPGQNHSPKLHNTAFYIEAGTGKVLDEFVKRNLWHPERTIDKHHANPPRYETEILSSLSYARAFETETVWIMCNAGGLAKDGYIGGSSVWMPLKGKVGGCQNENVELAIVDVDLDILKDARTLYKIRADRDSTT
ncbi:uncharacterized protein IL334_000001 [Kwoniella shivajii]|uniref:CN hydrolase domain-containing protein n=1 Tax=Kwoniella shivajii TaxID=564305 RepID=A0ABZ1CMX8_9TREE|nr:hypothetical protein IL334_000001 [Kwoniella shivajii]